MLPSARTPILLGCSKSQHGSQHEPLWNKKRTAVIWNHGDILADSASMWSFLASGYSPLPFKCHRCSWLQSHHVESCGMLVTFAFFAVAVDSVDLQTSLWIHDSNISNQTAPAGLAPHSDRHVGALAPETLAIEIMRPTPEWKVMIPTSQHISKY